MHDSFDLNHIVGMNLSTPMLVGSAKTTDRKTPDSLRLRRPNDCFRLAVPIKCPDIRRRLRHPQPLLPLMKDRFGLLAIGNILYHAGHSDGLSGLIVIQAPCAAYPTHGPVVENHPIFVDIRDFAPGHEAIQFLPDARAVIRMQQIRERVDSAVVSLR